MTQARRLRFREKAAPTLRVAGAILLAAGMIHLYAEELMVEFYRNILSGKLDRCQALRQAALTQRKIVQQRYGQDNPFFWGAFVFLGQAD